MNPCPVCPLLAAPIAEPPNPAHLWALCVCAGETWVRALPPCLLAASSGCSVGMGLRVLSTSLESLKCVPHGPSEGWVLGYVHMGREDRVQSSPQGLQPQLPQLDSLLPPGY